ncbi:hypothetical protein [Halomonas alimentaria]|uniref:Protein singed n=1 Tax=Halomonas alimentaria TaxID=147248 RepID=A0A7X5ARD7_9GAMM|nr:hypothetical protein [Halomonas alimentaria]NAW35001.1 hypothetical protein [Halomonas alimentaria]
MHTFITVADADSLLPAGWQGEGDAADAIRQANIFLSAQNLNQQAQDDPTPDPVLQAGAYAAQEAAQGKLFSDQGPAVKSKTVTAGPVTSRKEYAEGSVAKTAAMQMVTALLQPYRTKRHGAQILGRL